MSLGPARYELGADLTPLRSDLKAADAELKKTGAATESAFGKQAAGGIAQAEKQARGLRGTLSSIVRSPDIKKGLLAGLGLGGGFGVAMVIQQGIGMIADTISSAVKAAAEEQAQIGQLTAAIEANDAAWDGNIDTVEEVIRQRQQLAFADNEQRDALKALIAFTKDYTTASRLSLVAMDLARFKNMDLAAAAVLVGKAYTGSFAALKKAGVTIKEGSTGLEAIAELQKVVAGQTREYAESDLGKMERAQISINNLMEDFGTIILPLVGDAALIVSANVEGIAGHVANLVENITTSRDIFYELRETVGRDIENDLANMTRIVGTGGIALFSDVVGDAGFALEDLQRALQDAGQGMGLLHEEVGTLNTAAERAAFTLSKSGQGLVDLAAGAATADDRLGSLSEQADRLSADAARAVRQADRLADAMDAVADTSLEGAREEFRSVMKAAEQAAKDEAWAALNRQFKRLQEARRRYVRAGEFDSAAIIDAAIRENRELVAKVRLSSLAYRAEAGDRKAIAQLHRQGIDDAAALAKAIRTGNRQKQTALQKTSDELQDVVKDIQKLQDEAEQDVTIDVNVQTAQLDELEARLAELAGRGQIATAPTAAWPRATYRRGRAPADPPPPGGRGREGGRSTTINLTVNGHPTRAQTPGDIVRHLRRAGRQGDFEPRRQQGQWP